LIKHDPIVQDTQFLSRGSCGRLHLLLASRFPAQHSYVPVSAVSICHNH